MTRMTRSPWRSPARFLPFTLLAGVAGACGLPLDDGGGAESGGVEVQGAALQLDSELESDRFGGSGLPDPKRCWVITCVNDRGLAAPPFRLQARGRLKELTVWAGKYVDGMELSWKNLNNPRHIIPSRHVGGWGGRARTLTLADDEAIIAVSGRAGKYLDQLTVVTSKNRVMTWGGGGGGDFQVNLPPGDEVHGFAGVAGNLIDAISVLSYLP